MSSTSLQKTNGNELKSRSRRIFKVIFALMVVIAFTALNASAALNAYEPFNYATGSFVNNTASTGAGFTGNWTCGGAGTIVSGLTYSGLTTANNSLKSGGSRQFVSLATPLSSGTQWISFLYTASGNMGGNIDGVYFPNGGTGLFFGFGLAPNTGTQGGLGLGSMTTTGSSAQGASSLASSFQGTYGATYLAVLKIQFNTSGNNDTVTVYLNPVAGASAPGVTATYTLSSFDVGTIAGIGLNVQGGANITVDEIRVGDTYGDVVGYLPPPSAPTGVTATPGINSVALIWNASSGATGYKVLRGISTGNYTVTNNVAVTNFTDITAVGGTPYFYAVEATNSSGASANSSEVTATPTIALPATPGGVTATGTNGAANVSWNVATGAASYNVKRSTTSGTEATITNVSTTSYLDTAVANGTPYFYEVSATNSAGESGNSTEVSATPNVPPAAPTGLGATPGTNQVALSWTASAGASSYNVKRSTLSGSEVTITNVTTTSYTDSTAVKFTQYFYVVSALSGYGEGANSSEVAATPTGSYGPTDYESFNYALGTLANNTPSTGTGFTGNWTVSGSPAIVAGLTYSNLPTSANAYQHSAAGSQTTENFATPLSSGTKFISFLFKGSGNSGGDSVGVFLKGNNANSLFAGFHVPNGANTTGFGLGTVNSTVLAGATGLGSAVNIDNTAVHFIVLEIDFNTSGTNDTVSLWIDPPAGMSTPGVAANVVNSTFDVGTISAFGINITGGYNPIIDEVRVGDVYGDVAGYGSGPAPTIPTTLALSIAQGESVGWTAASTNSYQPQESVDNNTWTSIGSLLTGNATTSVYVASPQPYYRVLEILPGAAGTNVVADSGFETPAANSTGAANWSCDPNNTNQSVWATNTYGSITPNSGSSMLYLEGTTPASGPVTPPNAYARSDLFPVTGGLTYDLQFFAANPVKVGGANPQYRITYFNAGNGYISDSGFISFGSAGNTFTAFNLTNTAPAGAAYAQILFIQAVGGGNSFDWVTLLDDVTVRATVTFGATNILSATRQLGATFTGTVQTNGVTAGGASGTISFLTNSAGLSMNIVSAGSATSATTILSPPYTVTAIYSGDNTFIGSTNTLTVNHASAQVALQNLSQAYDGTAKTVTAITTPAGLTVSFTYNGSSAAPTNTGTYLVIGSVVDPLYVGGATNNLVITNGVSLAPITFGSSLSGGQITLTWPSDHLGWVLQSQTNSLNTGLGTGWMDVSGSGTSTQSVINIDPSNPSVYFRLRSP
ncbi:MAG TPA: MBG domain-containing protein [Candidatus Sulfotelmatobacter sp.]|nr:MBG domain-containing protein [Candidatus Sulfotelmatobacter sp.]